MTELKESLPLTKEEVLEDYRLVYLSRQASLIGRREVMSGKAKFGIFGGGKELAQVAMAHAFQPGDFRSGYYRDQTIMLAAGALGLEAFFAQLYAHADVEADPATAGRSMNAHFATRSLNEAGEWVDLTGRFNSSADVSPTGSQMPRLVGLAYASRLYRELEELATFTQYSNNGNEIAWGTVGNATCAEGMFWEALNAIGVLQSPAIISIWDDNYGISVPNEYQVLKEDMSVLLQGFQREEGGCDGYDIYRVRGWDYPALVETYQKAALTTREEHVPSIVHVVEMMQPQGHSTSGSHERYKSKERLAWEEAHDPVTCFRAWIVEEGIASEETLSEIEKQARQEAEAARKAAWEDYLSPIRKEQGEVSDLLKEMAQQALDGEAVEDVRQGLMSIPAPLRRDIFSSIHTALTKIRGEDLPARDALISWKETQEAVNKKRYGEHLHSETALDVLLIPPQYKEDSPKVYGFEVLNACFDAALAREPRLIAFGEDVGKLGDVNQGFKGLQEKYGPLRVTDTGIREATIVGQAIGMGMRGLRPLAEIQYLDYLLYALQILSDDLATLRWRTAGGQAAPVIVRTRGHRLEGIWHSGSLMAGVINLVRGIYVLVPRDMTQASGFYNTLLQADEPGIVVEVLNGYRLRERLPENIGEFTTPIGVPEVTRLGIDVTIITYGATWRIVMEAAEALSQVGIEAEVIDVRSLLPFDLPGMIVESLRKTNRVVFVDEDVPGGTTAYMMQKVLEEQGGYTWLDSKPRTLPGAEHRPAYGSDGDYFSKPNAEDIFYAVYDMMHEADPNAYPLFYR